jgi:hypothetical protein
MSDSSKPDLLNIMIASPCDVGWDNMQGDDRVRFCGQCKLNVYNTSVMTSEEIRALATQGRNCLQIYRRADGTMITDDCPVGLRRVRDGIRTLAKAVASIATFVIGCASVSAQTVPASCESGNASAAEKQSAQGSQQADKRAAEAYKEAQIYAAKGQISKADKCFATAIAAVTAAKSDPVFAKLVFDEYIAFLNKNKRLAEAKKVSEMMSKFVVALKAQPYYYAGRGSSHQKTSPTLPEGAPTPDNE